MAFKVFVTSCMPMCPNGYLDGRHYSGSQSKMLGASIEHPACVPENLGLTVRFAAKMAAEYQGLQADEFSVHQDGAVKGTGS